MPKPNLKDHKKRCLEASLSLILLYNKILRSIYQKLQAIKRYSQIVKLILITLLLSILLNLIHLTHLMKSKRYRLDRNKLLLI